MRDAERHRETETETETEPQQQLQPQCQSHTWKDSYRKTAAELEADTDVLGTHIEKRVVDEARSQDIPEEEVHHQCTGTPSASTQFAAAAAATTRHQHRDVKEQRQAPLARCRLRLIPDTWRLGSGAALTWRAPGRKETSGLWERARRKGR